MFRHFVAAVRLSILRLSECLNFACQEALIALLDQRDAPPATLASRQCKKQMKPARVSV